MVLWESRATFHYDARCLLLRFYIQQCQSLHLVFMIHSEVSKHSSVTGKSIWKGWQCLWQYHTFVWGKRNASFDVSCSRRSNWAEEGPGALEVHGRSVGFLVSFSLEVQVRLAEAEAQRDRQQLELQLGTSEMKGITVNGFDTVDDWDSYNDLGWSEFWGGGASNGNKKPFLRSFQMRCKKHFPIALHGFNRWKTSRSKQSLCFEFFIQPSSNWWQERRAVQRLKASLEAPSKRVAQNGRRDVHHSISNESSEGWHTWEILGEVTVWLWAPLRWWETGSFVKGCTGTLALGPGKTCSLWSRVSGWMRWSCFLVKVCPTQNKHALAQLHNPDRAFGHIPTQVRGTRRPGYFLCTEQFIHNSRTVSSIFLQHQCGVMRCYA